MGAIIKLGDGRPLKVVGGQANFVKSNPDFMGVRLLKTQVYKLGGREDGMEIKDNIIEAKQAVMIYPDINMQVKNYQFLVSYNPDLLEYGTVSCPGTVSSFDASKLCLRFDAVKKTRLDEFEYIFELYLID